MVTGSMGNQTPFSDLTLPTEEILYPNYLPQIIQVTTIPSPLEQTGVSQDWDFMREFLSLMPITLYLDGLFDENIADHP
ncbi:hypothetical protein C9426_22655 [Serratia sp. S1B]|nr:hypothetical protein C9426_22655 [Serratia sp. S1B]